MNRPKLMQLVIDNKDAKRSFTVTAKADGGTRIDLFDMIDDYYGVSASAFVAAINAVKEGDISLHINSPGGDVFAARAMVAAIAAHPSTITAYIDGLAASAASYVATACDSVVMQDGSMMMVHRASSIVWGNSADMVEMAGLLDKIDSTIAADYSRKTGKPVDEMMVLMAAETWMTSAEAVANGFADSVVENEKGKAAPSNKWTLSAYAKAPPTLAAPAQAVIDSAPPARKAAAALKNSVTLNDAEIAFLEAMIPHHQSAIDMVKSALPAFESDSMVEFAEEILEAQAGEIALMEMWAGVEGGTENKKKMPMKMQAETPDNVVPAPSMTQSNRNRLTLITAS